MEARGQWRAVESEVVAPRSPLGGADTATVHLVVFSPEGMEDLRAAAAEGEDPYQALGISRSATPEELRATWKQLMRENHPDSLAARGVPQEFIARASEKVARINAAWDRIKRERGL